MPTPSIRARALALDTPGGRPLFRSLSFDLEHGDRVALVGRNGVGKSTLLEVIAGSRPPDKGNMTCTMSRRLVAQLLEPREDVSPGELRVRYLDEALRAEPDLLLLDEPTHDLDETAVTWLLDALRRVEGALMVVSHDPRVLATFEHFFVVAESGGRAFHGTYDALLADLERAEKCEELAYVRRLNLLADQEARAARDRSRRERKKNLGRVHELGRGTPRILLNSKRSYAQEKQGKRAVRRAQRIGAAREWARAARRALLVELPLELVLPTLPSEDRGAITSLDRVAMDVGPRTLFEDVSLSISRGRVAITGPNGSGKSTLLSLLIGERAPTRGKSRQDPSRIGHIAQNANNWRIDESLIEQLVVDVHDDASLDRAAQELRAHRFPFALAERPLRSLSPGERVRAALIALLRRRPVPELLVLDEPTDHLDFVGRAALGAALASWTGGLVVVSHDRSFLEGLRIEEWIALGDSRHLAASL